MRSGLVTIGLLSIILSHAIADLRADEARPPNIIFIMADDTELD